MKKTPMSKHAEAVYRLWFHGRILAQDDEAGQTFTAFLEEVRAARPAIVTECMAEHPQRMSADEQAYHAAIRARLGGR